MRRRVIVDCFVLIALLMMSIGTRAAEVIQYDVYLEHQPLKSAISVLARLADVSIITTETELSSIMVGPVAGTYTVEEALRRLLSGTALVVTVRDSRSYEIRRAQRVFGPMLPVASPMTVLGSRLRPLFVAPASRSFNGRSLDQVGVGTVGELLKYSLLQPYALPEAGSGDGAQYADLRGLGPDMATVLINGRWVPPSATSAGRAFDLNAIPLTAVERVIVLDDAAAAAMGVRAIGGAVNIELQRARRWPTARVEYGAAAGGGVQRQVTLSAGSDGDTLKSSLLVDYFDRSELSGRTRAFWRDQDFSRFGGADWRSTATRSGNISSISGAPLPGLSSAYAAVPLSPADGDPAISDFQATAGQYTFDSLRRYSSIVPAARRLSVAANLEVSLDSTTAFVELFGVRRLTDYTFMPPSLTRMPVPASNAFNPFDESVYVWRLLSEIEPRHVTTESELLRVVSGLRGELGSWSWEMTALRSQEVGSHWGNNTLDPERLTSALASSDPNNALNVFENGPIGSPELVASLVAEPMTTSYRAMGSEFATTFHGPLFALPTGAVTSSLGVQWRTERTASARTVAIGHAELRVPLWPEALEARASIRSDDYSDVRHIVTPSYSLTWKPFDALEVRWSNGTNFRAPSSYELCGPSYSGQLLIADPRRQGQVASTTVQVGGNLGLQSVTSKSTAVSARIRPMSALEIGGNYWSTRINNRIMRVPASLLLEHEAEFQERVIRDAPTPQDISAGMPGVLRYLDLTMMNVGGVEASGVDAMISYHFNTRVGAFKFEVFSMWMDEFSTTDVPGSQSTNRVDVADPRGTIPHRRVSAAIHWRNRLAGSTVSARYVGSYEDTRNYERTGRRLDSQTLVDLQAWLELGEVAPTIALFDGVRMTAGMLNAFDERPQFAEVGSDLGYDPALSDPRQRFGYLRIEKRF
jgi:iron complex outermembrane recepter protein